MQNIRIGNDFPIEWRIYRLGEPEILNDVDVSVRLFDSYMKPVPFEYHIEDNEVIGVFEGRNQKRTGAYTLKLVKNYGRVDMVTIDEVNAFCLVQHSYQEGGGTSEPGVTINHVDLNTEISVATNGIDGDSAYKIALRNGFNGTEAQWLASLVGADGNDGQNAYECAVRLGYEGTEAEWLASLKGKDGKSTYELVKQHNPTYDKTEAEFAKEQIKKVVTSDKIPTQTLGISNPDSTAVLYTSQSLTVGQQTQARININAANLDNEIILEDADIDAYAADPSLVTSAVRVIPQTWTQAEKTQAQQNIGVADEARVIFLEEKMAILDKTGITVIGDVSELTTDEKDYLVRAINEVDAHTDTNTSHIGVVADLTVTNADGTAITDLVTAINILKNSNGMKLEEEAVPNLDMAKTYSIYNGVDEDGEDILVGQINIPLDKVAITGEVVVATGTEIIGTDTDGSSLRANPGERYLKLTVKNEANPIWIALAGLDYTAKQPETTDPLQVQVAIDAAKREISATIGEDTITKVELDKEVEAELNFTGYDHNKDNAAHADFGKDQLTTTAQTLAGAVNELDELQGEASNLPYRDVTDPDNPILPTITENIKALYGDKTTTYVVDALPDITNATTLATLNEKDIYILHEIFDVLDASGNKVQATEADGTPKVDTDGVTPVYEQEEYYTPYRLNDDKDKWLPLFHRHEAETTAIDFDTEITW